MHANHNVSQPFLFYTKDDSVEVIYDTLRDKRYSISEQLLGVRENRFHDIEDEILQEGHQRLPLPWLFHLSSDQLHMIRASSGILANKIVTALKQGSPPRPRSHDLNREYSPPPWKDWMCELVFLG